MASHIQISKLFLHDPTVARSQTEIFTAVAEDNEELQLLLLVDFPRARQEQAYLLDLIIKECVNTFDQTDETNPEALLEQILNALNTLLPEITPGKQGQWLRDLNLLVAITDNSQLHFAQTGRVAAFLIREGQLIEVSEPAPEFNILKIFSNITSGVINPEESVLFTTPALTDYLSEAKIQQTIENLTPYQAVERLEQYLEEVPTFVTFAAIIAKFTTRAVPERPPVTRRVTASLPVQPVSKTPKVIFQPRQAKEVEMTSLPNRRQKRARNTTLAVSGASILSGLRWTMASTILYLKLLGSLLGLLIRGLLRGFKFITSSSYRHSTEHAWWQSLDDRLQGYQDRFAALSKLQKIILSSSLIILIIMLNSIVFQGQGRQGNSLLHQYNEELVTISQKQAEADSQRAYQNDKGAEAILLEIDDLLHQLQPLNKDQEEQVKQLLEKNNRALNEVRHINYVENPVEVYNLGSFNQSFSSLVLWQGLLYVGAADGLYKLETESKKVAEGTFTNPRLLAGSKSLFVLDGSSIWRLNGSNLEKQTFNQHSAIQTVDAALLYNDNLYILDRSSGTIVRHSNTNQGFQDGTIWLQDASLLNSANDFAIDGNIYATKDDGEIIKLFKGQRVTYDYQRPYPAIGRQSQIATTLESELLYISDPSNQRLIILNKTGTINDQFTSPKFANIKGFAVDAEEKNIFVLNGSSVYQLPIRK